MLCVISYTAYFKTLKAHTYSMYWQWCEKSLLQIESVQHETLNEWSDSRKPISLEFVADVPSIRCLSIAVCIVRGHCTALPLSSTWTAATWMRRSRELWEPVPRCRRKWQISRGDSAMARSSIPLASSGASQPPITSTRRRFLLLLPRLLTSSILAVRGNPTLSWILPFQMLETYNWKVKLALVSFTITWTDFLWYFYILRLVY